MNSEESEYMRRANNEYGKVSGRPREVYEVSIPMLQCFRKADGYKNLVITHLDSSHRKIPVVTHYVDKITRKEARYSPYQEDLNKLEAVVVEFDGWDNEQAKKAKSPDQFPIELRRFASFLSKTVAPVAMGTTGPEKGAFVSWLPDLQ
jgi:adenylosuccinate synthase